MKETTPPPKNQEQAEYSTNSTDYLLKSQRMNLDAGLLGKLFGSRGNAPNNIAGLSVCLAFIVSGVAIWASRETTDSGVKVSYEILKYTLPVITGALGYMFGHGGANNE